MNKGIGLEISATFMFHHKKESKILKLRELCGKEDNENKVDKEGIRAQYHFHISSHLAVDRNLKDYSIDLMLPYFSVA